MDLKRKFGTSIGITPFGSLGSSLASASASITKLIVKNIPKSVNKNDIIENLKKIIQNQSINITIPAGIPADVAHKIEAGTNIAFLSCPNLSQLSMARNILNGKSLGDKKLQVDFYEVKKVIPTPAPAPIETSEEPKKKQKTEKKPKEQNKKADETKKPEETKKETSVENKKKETKSQSQSQPQPQPKEQSTIENNDNNENNNKEEEKQKEKEEETKVSTVRNNKAVINKITQQLSSCAESKNYVQLVKSYNYLKKIGAKPDHITYGVMLNACVRCQEYKKAKEVFDDAIKDNVANDVIYTTYIKALCEVDMTSAYEMIQSMISTKPNIRTFNSIFRGCVRSGDIEITKGLISLMKSNEIYPDSTTIEYLIKIYSDHLMIQDIWDLLAKVYERMEGQISPICFSRLSLASLLAGDIKSSVKALGITDDILAKAPQTLTTSHKNKGKLSERNKISSSLFERIGKQEINEECERVRSYLNKITMNNAKIKVKFYNMESFNKIYFSKNSFKTNVNRISDESSGKELDAFNELFNQYKKGGVYYKGTDDVDLNTNRYLKMEICSGHGHWVTERAGQDLDADWISLEIRYDRIFQIWSKAILESIDNLYIVGGDAHKSLKEVIPDGVLDEVYINYPNPPVWKGADRLINELFLVEINRCLKKSGTLTIVTDDKPYSEQIIEILSKSKKLLKVYKPASPDNTYLTPLAEDYGYSYFNKLWNNGQRVKRYCIVITKN
ncbi:hypothetical protein DICPUDRAFT_88144 [Dictyostelium purpureum]|uniref:tRNA (guanine(46)-N(7))-methyltransferase n=1 Tax=Dictyostelium purpureum TaxID=5786 RepID=F0ZMN2_DICPU|nr:uncharacterized protein DICPUDRAFT_88144 [Dictyostelium purpureum]EGC34806.1 hypothetical protein DICPUDRAFT_88144 [Dictyostelium purpureum]|eukprot:XP_003288663.1 hypothetical protein DICPUDRAFT_88144 [Dictyostelium purpureum]